MPEIRVDGDYTKALDTIAPQSLEVLRDFGVTPKREEIDALIQNLKDTAVFSPRAGLDRVKQLGHEGMVEQYELAEEMLAGKTWFFEERFSCADAYFYWTFRRGAAFGADLSRFKNCMAHRQRMEQRASVQALIAHEEQVKAEFARAA